MRFLKKHINNLWSEKMEKISRKSSKLPSIKCPSHRLKKKEKKQQQQTNGKLWELCAQCEKCTQ